VRTAYAATSNHQPAALLARKLIADGAIGTLFEAEFVSHYHWHERLPYGWPHLLAQGGGRLVLMSIPSIKMPPRHGSTRIRRAAAPMGWSDGIAASVYGWCAIQGIGGQTRLRARADPEDERERRAVPGGAAWRCRVAFNLIPEQVAGLKNSPDIDIVRVSSLDYLYLAVGEDPDHPALQKQAARQAIGYAIDYDGIINNLMGGNAVRPAPFLAVGVNGSTAELTKEIGYHQNLDRARALLEQAGLPDGSAGSGEPALGLRHHSARRPPAALERAAGLRPACA
jgi:hypothetical protein